MKNIKYMKEEISRIEMEFRDGFADKREESKITKQLDFLRTCIRYLETNPNPEFLFKEQCRLSDLVEYIKKTEIEKEYTKEREAEFGEDMGFTLANKQISVINFLLQ
jgi:hypothetical protein